MIRFPIFSYLRAHWQGSQGLAWAFWVNLVALRVAISIAQSLFQTERAEGAAQLPLALVVLWTAAHIIVFVWQVVGVMRAADHHLRELGSITQSWGAQLGVLVALFFVLTDIWSAWLISKPTLIEESFAERMDREHAEKYDLYLSDDNLVLLFTGEIALGSAKAVAAFLSENPDVQTLSFSSGGGNIYEARGLAKLIRTAQLNTVVSDECSSACTIAFMGGVLRQLSPEARLGFHQYQFDATYHIPFGDPAAEQARDLAIFQENGVADWFLEIMFQERPEGIWYPLTSELNRAGILVSD